LATVLGDRIFSQSSISSWVLVLEGEITEVYCNCARDIS